MDELKKQLESFVKVRDDFIFEMNGKQFREYVFAAQDMGREQARNKILSTLLKIDEDGHDVHTSKDICRFCIRAELAKELRAQLPQSEGE